MTSVTHVVRSDGFAGVERYIAETVTELDARGWQVTVIGGEPARMAAEVPSSVRVLPARSVAEVARALWSLPTQDVVHAHMTAAEVPAAALKRRVARRLVVTRHFAGRRGRRLAGRLAAPLVAARVDEQFAISRFVADSVAEASTVLHNGVRRSREPRVPREQTVVLLHRLEPEKQTALALEAWARSELAGRGWRLLVFGDGSERTTLLRTYAHLLDGGGVHFAGFTRAPRAELARCGVLLATAPSEPFGLSVVEAMAEGAPVVAARGGAHVETLGADGCYFPPADVEACAAALREFAASPERRVTVGDALRLRYEQLFTVERHVDRLTASYRSLLAGLGSP